MNIQDVPTEQLHRIIELLLSKGWQCISSLEGIAGSVDYQEMHLMQGEHRVKFVWDNWSQGEISADKEIEEVRALL